MLRRKSKIFDDMSRCFRTMLFVSLIWIHERFCYTSGAQVNVSAEKPHFCNYHIVDRVRQGSTEIIGCNVTKII